MAPTLSVHYRRLLEDYHDVKLTVTAGTTSFELEPLCRTSYGSVFRFVLPTANALTIRPCDDIEYRISPAGGHVFLAQGCEHVLPNPFSSARFLLALIAHSRAWLRVTDSTGVTQESFPVYKNLKRVACVVDRDCFTGRDLKLTVCTNNLHLTKPPRHSNIVWKGNDHSNFVDIVVEGGINPTFSDSSEAALQLLCHEADVVRGVSKFIRHLTEEDTPKKAADSDTAIDSVSDGSQVLFELLHGTSRPPVLKVYFQMLDQTTHLYSLQVKSSTSMRTIRREKDLYRSSAIFQVPFERGAVGELTLTPVHVLTKKPCRRPVVWRPQMGFSIALSESYDGLQLPAVVDKVVQYHRYGEIEDWDAWQLQVWNEECDVTVKGQPQIEKGVVMFDLSGTLFRKGSVVNAQPIRTKPVDVNGISAQRVVVLKDVVRTWTAGSIEDETIFMVQGETGVLDRAPDQNVMEKNRFVDITYRRWDEEEGYEGWDLWVWEDFENRRTCPTITQLEHEKGQLGARFVLDRSCFGLGTEISIIPRRVGEVSDEKDSPVRIWNVDMLSDTAPPGIIIVQGTNAVLCDLAKDALTRLVAEIGRDGKIYVHAPAPFDWFSPANSGECREVAVTMGKSHPIDVKEVVVESPVQLSVELEDVDLTDEDFLVEDVRVCVDSFSSAVLRWEKCNDIDEYYYSGTLGVEYKTTECLFRCFAPLADCVSVILYDEPEGNTGRKVVPMRRIPEGCWKAIVSGDLKGKFYKLLASGADKLLFPGVEVIDPYSKCNTGHAGRGLIFGIDNTPIAPRPDIPLSQTIVYELHIRDVTIDEVSGVCAKGKYLGLTERETKVEQKTNAETKSEKKSTMLNGAKLPYTTAVDMNSTCLDHIVQMGVTAVQIMPIQDFDNDERSEDYRWGYMPVHFNSPDGWYASDVNTKSRITEFKKLVDGLHKAGLKVIMDVVYNHTAEDANEMNHEARFSFNGLAPRYYYRNCGNTPNAHTGDRTCALRPSNMPNCGGCYSNGSGCGNELRTEAPMVRKFVLDSLKYWVTEYKVDGFRFDLLGLVDVETMTQATKMLRGIDRNIVVYGEPWCGGLTPIAPTDKGKQRSKGFGVFNNDFRDAIRGSPFGVEETFVMDGGRLDEMKKGILGSIDTFADMPLESINYVECHDNYTLWDHIQMYVRERTDEIQFSDEDVRRMHVLAATVVLTSQGVPFLQCGQEMCRTKFDVENSYESPDHINKVRWTEKKKHWNIVQYYAGLIRMRRLHPELFALGSAKKIRQQIAFYEDLSLAVPERCIAYRILSEPESSSESVSNEQEPNSDSEYCDAREIDSTAWSAVVILFNPTPTKVQFPLPGDGVAWIQVVDERYAGVEKIAGPFFDAIDVSGRSAAILRRATDEEQSLANVQHRLACVTDVYANSIGDDVLSEYTVSLRTARTPHEELLHADLVTRRKQNWASGVKVRENIKAAKEKAKLEKATEVGGGDIERATTSEVAEVTEAAGLENIEKQKGQSSAATTS